MQERLVDPGELLEVVTVMVRLLRRAAAQRDGLSLTEFRVLKRLGNGFRLVRDLAEDLDVAAPTVSSVVESLTRRGLVHRRDPEEDRREVPLAITAEGLEALENARERQVAALDGVLAQLSPEDRVQFTESMAALRRALRRPARRLVGD